MPKKDNHNPGAFDLFSRFTHLRQSGLNRDDAWYQVCDEVPDMTEVTRNAFLTLAKDWERREGHKYRHRENNAHATVSGEQLAQAAEQVQQQMHQKAALTGHLNPAMLSAQHQQRLEQLLDQLEDDDEDDGGQQTAHNHPAAPPRASVKLPTPVRPAQPVRPQPDNEVGTAQMRYEADYFGPNTIMLAYFKNFPHPLRVNLVGEDEMFIGRATENSAMAPDIDLNPVNAGNWGVSRMHAVITRRENKLLLADLKSMNYTYINGMRLMPEEYYIVKDGDEIWFGQLHCQIRFQHK
ncbi:MAG: FHA domain-containing protein [Anaerolineae bacterium]|nr:FHA domain-containing protein [Anaerolineae bacterium]